MKHSKFTVISLFSGGMGLDIGLEKTGYFELLACVEKVPAFCQTIRHNCKVNQIGNKQIKIYQIDINNLDPLTVLADLNLQPGELDLLIGGPPCQSFSTTGKRGTIIDPRGTLLWQFLRFVEVLQPKFFLMENVRGLMSAAIQHRSIAQRPDQGGNPLLPEEEQGSVIRQFVHDLNNNYRLDCFEVNAVNYGVPQLRERSLFIGNRFNQLVDFPPPMYGMSNSDEQLSLFNPGLKPYVTLGDALRNLSDPHPLILDFSPRKKQYLAMIPPGGNWRCLSPEIAEEAMGKAYFAKGGRSGWWRRLSFDLPCPTIMTMPNHASTSLCHPTEVRALSLRECARVQQFPDDWEFCGTIAEQYTQVGNAVPIGLAIVAGELIANQLSQLYQNNLQRDMREYPACRIVYLKSHVRTRQWYKSGQNFIWQDGADNQDLLYNSMKTTKKVRLP